MNTSLIVMLTVCWSSSIALLVALWKIDTRVIRLEAMVKLLENEIKAIHDKEKED